LKDSFSVEFNLSFPPRIKYGVNSSGNPESIWKILDSWFRRSDRPKGPSAFRLMGLKKIACPLYYEELRKQEVLLIEV
jgi:hypothetical protein